MKPIAERWHKRPRKLLFSNNLLSALCSVSIDGYSIVAERGPASPSALKLRSEWNFHNFFSSVLSPSSLTSFSLCFISLFSGLSNDELAGRRNFLTRYSRRRRGTRSQISGENLFSLRNFDALLNRFFPSSDWTFFLVEIQWREGYNDNERWANQGLKTSPGSLTGFHLFHEQCLNMLLMKNALGETFGLPRRTRKFFCPTKKNKEKKFSSSVAMENSRKLFLLFTRTKIFIK